MIATWVVLIALIKLYQIANDDMLAFIRSVVQHWLEKYGTQLSGAGNFL